MITRRMFTMFAALMLAGWTHGSQPAGSIVIDDLGNLVIDDLGNQVVTS